MDLIIEHRVAWQRQRRGDWLLFHPRVGVSPARLADRLLEVAPAQRLEPRLAVNWTRVTRQVRS